jgi:hypothetical protein
MNGQSEQVTTQPETNDVSGYVLLPLPVQGIAPGGCVIIFNLPKPPPIPQMPTFPHIPGATMRIERVG